MKWSDLQLRSSDEAVSNLNAADLASHFRLRASFVRMVDFFVVALETDFGCDFRSDFSGMSCNFCLALVTNWIILLVSKDIESLFLLDCFLFANWRIGSIEVMVSRFEPVGVISADLAISVGRYAGWTRNYFLSLMTSLSKIFRFQFETLLLPA